MKDGRKNGGGVVGDNPQPSPNPNPTPTPLHQPLEGSSVSAACIVTAAVPRAPSLTATC